MSILILAGAGIAVFVAAILVVNAITGFSRSFQGYDEGAVDRRLQVGAADLSREQRVEILRESRDSSVLGRILGPIYERFARFVRQSHLKTSPERLFVFMAFSSAAAFVVLVLLLPGKVTWMALLLAPVIGVGGWLLYIGSERKKLRAQFEEQLPDAIDLIVRSLKIGHPVSSAIALIGQEMPAPIGPEFAIIAEQVSYGHDLPLAVMQMQERVPAPDLAYFSMAIQIQMESGGNLVESLQKLASVVRDRYRMFRKVHAITSEGRFSAWALSLFPFAIAVAIQAIRPDYYSKYYNEPWFPYVVMFVVGMLVVNVIMMRLLTSIKV